MLAIPEGWYALGKGDVLQDGDYYTNKSEDQWIPCRAGIGIKVCDESERWPVDRAIRRIPGSNALAPEFMTGSVEEEIKRIWDGGANMIPGLSFPEFRRRMLWAIGGMP